MVETSRFWDGTTVGDATASPYDAATEFADVLATIAGEVRLANRGAVFSGIAAELAPSLPSPNVLRIGSGRAMVHGTWYDNSADLDVGIPSPSAATRVDTITLTKSWSGQTVRIVRVVGVEGGGVPALTQSTGTTWQTPLCDVTITTGGTMTVTDRRQFLTGVSDLDLGRVNMLTNGGFEVWQRKDVGETFPKTASGAFTADRWSIDLSATAGGTCSVDREATIVSQGSRYSLAYTPTAGTGIFYIAQKIEDFYALRGRTICVSVDIRAPTAANATIFVSDGVSGGSTVVVLVAGLFVRCSFSYTVPLTASELRIFIGFNPPSTGQVYYIDNAVLALGTGPAAFIPLLPADDLARCQRYYEAHMGKAGAGSGPALIAYGGDNTNPYGSWVPWHTQKGGLPSVTKNGTWVVSNCAQPSVSAGTNPTVSGYMLSAQPAAVGRFYTYPDGVDDGVVAEYNP